ncbi:hypothetical protein MRB53_041799 [Persea americana]|nr:hypothetical protein MRB53_041799 [Persea americana]
MARPLAVLALPLAIFTLVAIILINIGGVNPSSNNSLPVEKNKAFYVLDYQWNYTVTPEQSFTSYAYHVYLNRLCPLEEAIINFGGRTSVSKSNQCSSLGVGYTLKDGIELPAPNALVAELAPFEFDNVHFAATFALYTVAAVFAALTMFLSLGAVLTSGRAIWLAGVVVSSLGFIFTLVASAVATWQMVHLRNELLDYSATFTPQGFSLGSSAPAGDVEVRVQNVSLGSAVLGLTWSSTVAMLIEVLVFVGGAVVGGKRSGGKV